MRHLLRTTRPLLIAAMCLLLAACGDDPTELTAGQPGEGEERNEETRQDSDSNEPAEPEEALPVDESPDSATQEPAPTQSDYERVAARVDLLNPGIAPIEELAVDADGTTLLVRYSNASEPCSGARVTVNETDETVEAMLETGLDPNAAAMSCIAGVFGYEIAVPLAAPVGSRQLIAVAPEPTDPPDTDPFEGAEFTTDQYLGLTEAEAIELGEIEQRTVRVTRIDDEFLQVTMDFSPTRVNIELEAGVVVVATSG